MLDSDTYVHGTAPKPALSYPFRAAPLPNPPLDGARPLRLHLQPLLTGALRPLADDPAGSTSQEERGLCQPAGRSGGPSVTRTPDQSIMSLPF